MARIRPIAVAEGKCRDEGDGEYDPEPSCVQRSFDVVGGTAFEGIAFFFLIDLRERTLNESGCRTQDRHKPHPESGAGTADDDRGCHSGHVARSDTGSCCDHKRLERGNALVPLFFLHHAVQRVFEAPDLYEPCADREIDSAPCQKIDQQPGVQNIVDLCKN